MRSEATGHAKQCIERRRHVSRRTMDDGVHDYLKVCKHGRVAVIALRAGESRRREWKMGTSSSHATERETVGRVSYWGGVSVIVACPHVSNIKDYHEGDEGGLAIEGLVL